jgi:hypothetical protein
MRELVRGVPSTREFPNLVLSRPSIRPSSDPVNSEEAGQLLRSVLLGPRLEDSEDFPRTLTTLGSDPVPDSVRDPVYRRHISHRDHSAEETQAPPGTLARSGSVVLTLGYAQCRVGDGGAPICLTNKTQYRYSR